MRLLRSALALFAEALGEEPRRRWNGEMRWLPGELGPARDLDVLAGGLLPPVLGACGDDPELPAFRDLAEAGRAGARRRVREALASQRYADLAFRFAAWLAREGWRDGADAEVRLRQRGDVVVFAAGVLHRRYRKVVRLGRRFGRLGADERHQVRIALKRLRYEIDFFADLFPRKRLARFREAATRIQERLGHLNDVAVAGRLARELVGTLDPGARAGLWRNFDAAGGESRAAPGA
jgi:CHAD domain-containing protein